MKFKILVALLTVVTLTACTTRTQIIPECKDGILHFTYKQTQHETGIIKNQVKGVLTYEDNSVVRCIEEKQK